MRLEARGWSLEALTLRNAPRPGQSPGALTPLTPRHARSLLHYFPIGLGGFLMFRPPAA